MLNTSSCLTLRDLLCILAIRCQTLFVHVMDERGCVLLNISECFASFLKDSAASLPLRGSLSCSACLWSAKALRAVLVEKVPRRTTVLARLAKAKATSTPALSVFPLAGAFELSPFPSWYGYDRLCSKAERLSAASSQADESQRAPTYC